MEPPHIGLAPQVFAQVFPFHLAINRQLDIVQAGEVVQRVCPDLQIGSPLGGCPRINPSHIWVQSCPVEDVQR